jgi:type I restriction enzyme M protein
MKTEKKKDTIKELEKKLWTAADKLRKKVEVHDYKYVVLGLIFLRYISYAFDQKKKELEERFSDPKSEFYIEDVEDRKEALKDKDFYLEEGVLYVPEEAHWDYLRRNAHKENIGQLINRAIEILEEKYPEKLKDVVPKIYTDPRVNLSHEDLAYLIDLFTDIEFGDEHKARDIFGEVYEYFLGKFAEVEGKRGGEFYTPRSLTRLIVKVLDVKCGTIFDPACGSGGFFVSALKKLEEEGEDRYCLEIHGQEAKPLPWKLCKMNLAIRGVTGDIRLGDTYHDDKFINERFDYVVANPPFNDSKWGADKANPNDPRYKYGVPPDNNGNFAWIQIFIYHLKPTGKAGFVMANGALSVGGIEGEIRKKIIEDDLVYGIVACPPKLFTNVSLPVSLWFCRKQKPEHMKGKVLFIYAKDMYEPVSRKQVTFTEEHIERIAEKFRLFEQGASEKEINEIGFAKVATIDEIRKKGYVLTPGRYVGIKLDEEDEPFEEKMKMYSEELSELLKKEEELTYKVKEVFKALGFEI